MRVPPHLHGPPAGAIDIGHSHYIVIKQYRGEDCGLDYYHLRPDKIWCKGWITFKGSKWSLLFGDDHGWKVEKREPLTLEPSLKCRVCLDHGYIREGRWVLA